MSMPEPTPPAPLRVRGHEFHFGTRTYIMGIVNVTPDSFSGDGLLAAASPLDAAVAQAERMVAEGADIIDVGGESTRPGHDPVSDVEERRRVVATVRGIRARLPEVPISIDTRQHAVAAAALEAGADMVNDVGGVTAAAALASVAAAHGAPYIVMHSRAQPIYHDVVSEVIADLQRALGQAEAAGCTRDMLIADPGIGFGKTAEQNLDLLGGLAALRVLGRPILLGTSRKSTIGRVLDLPVEERLEGTLATTALGIAAGVDIVRVHDVAANVRVARMSDAIIRGPWRERASQPHRRLPMDRITLSSMRFEGLLGETQAERAFPQMVEVDLVIEVDLTAAATSDALADTVDYGPLVELTGRTVEGGNFCLLEGLAGALAAGVLDQSAAIDAVTVRVRKLAVPMDVSIDHAEVELRRERSTRG
jgi:dihydropteroate synthase